MPNERNNQWHPAFCSAMRLELSEDAGYLEYMNEYNLNSKPLQIDLLIVKKKEEIELQNEIGKMFRRYNIIEYKSPDDAMNVNTYLKVCAYACLFKTQEEHIDDIKLDEITITMVREKKPKKLLRWFKRNGYRIAENYPGIYYIKKENHFETQVIVSKRLSKKNQKWLTLLSNRLEWEDAERALRQLQKLPQRQKDLYGSAVLEVVKNANEKLFKNMKEDVTMCDFIREFLAEEIEEALQKAREQAIIEGREEGMKEGMKGVLVRFLEAGNSIEEISRITLLSVDEVRELVTT